MKILLKTLLSLQLIYYIYAIFVINFLTYNKRKKYGIDELDKYLSSSN